MAVVISSGPGGGGDGGGPTETGLAKEATLVTLAERTEYPLPAAQVDALAPPDAVDATVTNWPSTFPLPADQVAALTPSGGGAGGDVNVTNLPADYPLPAAQHVALLDALVDVIPPTSFPLPQAQVDAIKPPATQPVSGSVNVGNFPATQAVSGSVTADVTPASPAAGDYLPVRLTDGTAFYTASGGGGSGGAVDQGAPGTVPWLTRPVGLPTYYAVADAVAFAANKHHISIFNALTSGKVVKIKKLFAINLQTGAISGAVTRFNVIRTTTQALGTAITPTSMDTTNPALTGITVATGATITDGPILFPWLTTTEEIPATSPLNIAAFQQMNNLILEGNEVQEPVLREGQGLSVKQATSTTAGSYAWLLAFTVETA